MSLDEPLASKSSATTPLAHRWFGISASGAASFVVFTAAAMLVYPGGTPDQPHRRAYSFFTNCFSDLGRTRTFDDHSNLAARTLFTLAMVAGAISLITFFRAFATTTASYRPANRRMAARLSHTGAILGLGAAACFV